MDLTSVDLASLTFVAVVGVLLAASAGVRAFLGPLAISFAAWIGWLELDPSLAWIGHPLALGSILAGLTIEVLSDKIPVLHHFLDVVHVAVKPVTGALVGATLVGVDPSLTTGLVALIGGGSVAAATHVGKAALRVGSSAATAGAAAPGHSLVEDVVALGLVALAGLGMYGAA